MTELTALPALPVGSLSLAFTLAVLPGVNGAADVAYKVLLPALPTLAAVATSGSYADLTNKPTIPAAPNLAPYALTASLSTVALSGSYADLTGKPVIPAAYTLPPATTTTLGGVKASASIAAAGDGTLILAQNGATTGQVLQWNGTTWTPATVSAGSSYTLPVASGSVLGGVKAGSNVTIAGDGTLSVPAPGVSTFNTRSGAVTLTATDVIAVLTAWATTAPTSPPGNGAPWLNGGLLSFANS